MRILITGATGFLGRPTAARLAAEHDVIPAGGRTAPPGGLRFDLRDPDALRGALAAAAPDCVVHLAAYREPDFCEDAPGETRRLNVEPVRVMCESLPAPVRIVFISTDYVFDGENPPYREDSARRAVNVYGKGKMEAEDVAANRPNSLILRIPLLVGAGASFGDSGFLRQIVDSLRDPSPQEADHVLRRFPTWTRDVAEALAFLIRRGERGAVHMSGPDGLTRYDMIAQAAEMLGMPMAAITPSTRVIPRRAARPRDSQLATDKLRAMGFDRFTSFRDVVRAFAAEFPEAQPRLNAVR